jgi:adenylate kinase
VSDTKNLIVFLGPPGAGKGSLSQLCVEAFGWVQLSTGFLCRKHISEQTELGKSIDFSIKSGKLIDDSLIVEMVEKWLTENAHRYTGFILDGFPRTVEQAESLQNIIRTKMKFCDLKVIKLSVADDVVTQRLHSRFVCENKDCQRVYSLQEKSVLVGEKRSCDLCSSPLIRRSDDTDETVKTRLKTYRSYENLLIDFYSGKGQTITELNVEKPLMDVFEEFKQIFNDGI